MTDRKQTAEEEIWNAITHGAGVLFCVVALPILIWYAMRHGTVNTVWAVSIFGFGMLMVYMSSTLFHVAKNANTKRALQVWDHISIYLLIAGSYTPLVIRFIEPGTATLFLTVMWGIVAAGSFLKVFYTGRFQLASTILYLAMGWMALFIIKPMLQNIPNQVLTWLVIGGLSYTFGVIFYVRERKPYHHAIWHVFVLAGSVTHYIAVFKATLLPLNT